jgi:hypothetical protein
MNIYIVQYFLLFFAPTTQRLLFAAFCNIPIILAPCMKKYNNIQCRYDKTISPDDVKQQCTMQVRHSNTEMV